MRLGIVRHLIGSLTTDQAPQSIRKSTEQSYSNVKFFLSFSLVLSKAALLNYNLFLKRLLQVHVSQSSTVADHCRSYALNDPKELSFQATYDHNHSDVCERGATLASTLNDIDKALDAQSQNMTSNRKEELFSSQECKDRCIPMGVSSPPFCQSGWHQSTAFGTD